MIARLQGFKNTNYNQPQEKGTGRAPTTTRRCETNAANKRMHEKRHGFKCDGLTGYKQMGQGASTSPSHN